MQIAFFLIPKKELVCLKTDTTMRQALERMEHNSYTAVPFIDDEGRYAGTITEGDLLWKIKNSPGLTLNGMEKIKIKDIARRKTNRPVRVDSRIIDLLHLAGEQNFVPVIDDQGIFIGIIRRREIIGYCAEMIRKSEEEKAMR